jgi:hypothetical protein
MRWESGGAAVSPASDDYVPDSMAFAADGRAFVHHGLRGCVRVVAGGVLIEHIDLGEHATNCISTARRST